MEASDRAPLDTREGPGGLSFCNDRNDEALAGITGSGATVVICHDRIAEQLVGEGMEKTIVIVVNPRFAYIQVANGLHTQETGVGIDTTARNRVDESEDAGATFKRLLELA
jgi:hypothetical protein